jgi:Mn2+/Fe2+ NRAMP family transporter
MKNLDFVSVNLALSSQFSKPPSDNTPRTPLKSIRTVRPALLRYLEVAGPGLIMAGAAVGVSHLVQSTRAGADYGFAIAWAIVLSCAVKYPFLQFGPRFAAATGKSLLEGYAGLGRWALILFACLTLGTMFTTLAGVTIVTAGLAARLFGIFPDPRLWSMAILLSCIALLTAGRYSALDGAMKLIIAVLAASTLAAAALASGQPQAAPVDAPSSLSLAALPFLLALMGWMPIPVDVSVWHSLWTLERGRQKRPPSVRESVADFNIGYGLALLMALAFLFLGARLMFGTGEQFAASPVAFASQLVGLYTRTLGAASAPLIAVAVLTTMVSTTLAVTDAYPRVAARFGSVWRGEAQEDERLWYRIGLFLIPAGALVIIFMFADQMTLLVDIATTLAFLSAPLFGWMNLRVILGPLMPPEARPSRSLVLFSYACLALLTCFAATFLVLLVG